MQHKTHKRFIRELPMELAIQAAGVLARATVDFVLETKPATRSSVAYLSCHFEQTLDAAIEQIDPNHHNKSDRFPDIRLRVALDPETPEHCTCPPGTDRCITQGGRFPACTACGRRLKGHDER